MTVAYTKEWLSVAKLVLSQTTKNIALTFSFLKLSSSKFLPMDVLSFDLSTIAPRRLRSAGFLFARNQGFEG